MDLKKKRGEDAPSTSSSSIRNVCHTGYMSQVSGSSGGGANDRGRFHRGGKSIMMRDNGRGPPLSKDYRQLLSPGDQWEESRVVESGGGSGGSRSHKNRSYRREGEAEERESRGCAFMDYKGRDRGRSSSREDARFSATRTAWSSAVPPPPSRLSLRLEDAGDRSSSSSSVSSSNYPNPQAARRFSMGSEGPSWHRDDSPLRNPRSRTSEDPFFGGSAEADRMQRMKVDRRRMNEAEAEGERHSSLAQRDGGKDRWRPPESWESEPQNHASSSSAHPSLLQGMGRSSLPSRTTNVSAAAESWLRSDSTSSGSHQHPHPHQHQHQHHERKLQQPQQQVKEVFIQPLLCRPLDAGSGTRQAPWSFNDVASSLSLLALPAGGAASATASSILTFGQIVDSATSFHHRRLLTEEMKVSQSSVFQAQREARREAASGAALSISASHEGMNGGVSDEHLLPRATSFQSLFRGYGVTGGEGLLSASTSGSVQPLEPRLQRSLSEAPSGRLRLGWGQGLARRAISTQEQPSPRVVPPNLSKVGDRLDRLDSSGKSIDNTLPMERAREEVVVEPTEDVAGAVDVTNGKSSVLKQRVVSSEKRQRRQERSCDDKRSEQRAGMRRRLRRMLLAFVRHLWRESATRGVERASTAASAFASVTPTAKTPTAATGTSSAPMSGKKDPLTERERGAGEAVASPKMRRERSSEATWQGEEGTRTLKRQKSALSVHQEAAAAAKLAEKKAARAKLEKYRTLSCSSGFPLCGLLPMESMRRAVKATACVREKQPGTEAETTGMGTEVEAELVRLPSREDILAVLESLNSKVEHLQEEVATVEEEVSNATVAAASYRAPWWSNTYASVIRLRREAAEQLDRRKVEEDQRQEQQQQLLIREGAHMLCPVSGDDAAVTALAALNAPVSIADAVQGGSVEADGNKRSEREALTKRELIKSAVQEKKAQIRRYIEQLADKYLDINETWKRKQPGADDDEEHGHFLQDSMRTTRTFAASQRSSYPSGGGGDRTSSRSGGLSSSRGGDFAASEYDVALMARGIEEKEKMKLRMDLGGATVPAMLLVPELRGRFEFLDTSNALLTTDGEPMRCAGRGLREKCSGACNCPLGVERQSRYVNPWSDMEKCIFLDKFLQYPKNFRKIASFLRRKSTHDAIEFYYDSKQCINYKALLKENEARRRGTEHELVWLKQAARQVGATVDLRYDSNDREIVRLYPPANDYLYTTFHKHPGSRPFHHTASQRLQHGQSRGGRGRATSPSSSSYAFSAQSQAQVFGGEATSSTESSSTAYGTASATKSSFGFDVEMTSAVSRTSSTNSSHAKDLASCFPAGPRRGGEIMGLPASSPRAGGSRQMEEEDSEGKKVMTKWTEEEKQKAIQLLEVYGKQWALISGEMGGTKKPEQIKNFFSNYKKKYRLDERLPPPLPGQRRREPKRAKSPPPPTMPMPPLLSQQEAVPVRSSAMHSQVMAMLGAPGEAISLPRYVVHVAPGDDAQAAIMVHLGSHQHQRPYQSQQQQWEQQHFQSQQVAQQQEQQQTYHLQHSSTSITAQLPEQQQQQQQQQYLNHYHHDIPTDGVPQQQQQQQQSLPPGTVQEIQQEQARGQFVNVEYPQGIHEAVTAVMDVAAAQHAGNGGNGGGKDKTS